MKINNLKKSEDSNSGGLTALIILFVLILLVVVGGGGYLYKRQMDQEQIISGYRNMEMADTGKGVEEISATDSQGRSGEIQELNTEASGSLGRV